MDKDLIELSFKMFADSRRDSLLTNNGCNDFSEFYSKITHKSYGNDEILRKNELFSLCNDYILRYDGCMDKSGDLMLDKIFPDDVIYSLTEDQRFSLIKDNGLSLIAYQDSGRFMVQWNGKPEKVGQDMLENILGYPKRVVKGDDMINSNGIDHSNEDKYNYVVPNYELPVMCCVCGVYKDKDDPKNWGQLKEGVSLNTKAVSHSYCPLCEVDFRSQLNFIISDRDPSYARPLEK